MHWVRNYRSRIDPSLKFSGITRVAVIATALFRCNLLQVGNPVLIHSLVLFIIFLDYALKLHPKLPLLFNATADKLGQPVYQIWWVQPDVLFGYIKKQNVVLSVGIKVLLFFTWTEQDGRTFKCAVSWLVPRRLYVKRKRRKERERPGDGKEQRESFPSFLLPITFRAPIDLA